MSGECVKVMVRVRPMNSREKETQSKSCLQVDQTAGSIALNPALPADNSDTTKIFTFDSVFAQESSQSQIYEQSAFSLVESVFEGYNGTIFAYGQTGCGKTFTMMGDPQDEEMKGIIPRTFHHLIDVIESESSKEFLVRCSYIEIYNEEIHDLLSKDVKARYELKESPEKGIFIKDLNKVVVKSVAAMEQLMITGNKNRSTGETAMNKDSSRSHSIFTVYVEISETDANGEQKIKAGKLNLVDLAGSERQAKTQATGDRLKEANKINLSLSALGNVISALVDGKNTHIPYRDSKLTRLLQDSLGGNTKTIMIAAVSPSDFNFNETLGTLRYASRAKKIKNKPKINEDPKDALLREQAEEINRLKEQLGLGNNYGKDHHKQNGKDENNEEDSKWKEAHDALHKDKERIEIQLKERQEQAEVEKEQRFKMEQLLNDLQRDKMVGGSGGTEEEKKQYLEMKKKLKKQQKEHDKLIQEAKRKEEEIIETEKNYQSLQEEVEANRRIIKKLKNKCNQTAAELQDLQKEKNQDTQELLETIRVLEADSKLANAILEMAFQNNELQQIKNNAQWNDSKNSYVITPFYFKNKEIRLPKLTYTQAMEQVEIEKDSRAIYFDAGPNRRKQIKEKSSFCDDASDEYDQEATPKDSMNKRPKKSEKESRGRNLVPKRSLNDMTNNFSSHQRFSLVGKDESFKAPKRNLNGIQLNPLSASIIPSSILDKQLQNAAPSNPQEPRRNPKTQQLIPLGQQNNNNNINSNNNNKIKDIRF